MTPYYADDFVTIYLGDSLETTVVHPELLIMDPPYGIEWEQHGGGRRGKSRGMLRHRGGDTIERRRFQYGSRHWTNRTQRERDAFGRWRKAA